MHNTCLSHVGVDSSTGIRLNIKVEEMAMNKNPMGEEETVSAVREASGAAGAVNSKVKFEVFGEEMLEKEVKLSGNSGRVYLPPDWVGHRVKIIRID